MQASLMPAAAAAAADKAAAGGGGACRAASCSCGRPQAQRRCGGPRVRAWSRSVLILCIVVLLAVSAHAAPTRSNATSDSSGSENPTAAPPQALPTHKPLHPLEATDGALFVVVAVALFIASGAGVGGGVLIVPALLIISNFSSTAAVALSNLTILSSSVAAIGFNIPRRSPIRPGPLIDWDLVVLLGPPIVAGSIAGSYINLVVPGWITKVLLLLLVVPMAWRMLEKARSMHARETAARPQQAAATAPAICSCDGSHVQQAALPPAASPPLTSAKDGVALHRSSPAGPAASSGAVVDVHALTGHTGDAGSVHGQPGGSINFDPEAGTGQKGQPSTGSNAPVPPERIIKDAAVRRRLQQEQEALLPPLQVGLVALMVAYVAVSALLAGLLMACGTWGYWVVALSPMLLMLVVWAVARRHVLWKQTLMLHTPGDVLWTATSTVVYPLICISAGVIAGLLGLGGGLVLGPLLLEVGVEPASSAASTQVTLLISSATAAVVYAVSGAAPWDYGAVLIVLGFAATLAGLRAVAWLVARLQRPSVLVSVLAVMFTAAACAAAAAVVLAALDLAHHPARLTAHRGVCVAKQL